MVFDETKFAAFINQLKLQFFGPSELLVGRYKTKNGPPPENLWPNIVPTILVLDALRKDLGKPIKIINCYRTAANNKLNPGRAARSQHIAFNAVDFQVSGMKSEAVVEFVRENMRDKRWLYSPITFERVEAVGHDGGKIGFTPLQKVSIPVVSSLLGCMFLFKGGLGTYPSFVHLDTRGKSENWG